MVYFHGETAHNNVGFNDFSSGADAMFDCRIVLAQFSEQQVAATNRYKLQWSGVWSTALVSQTMEANRQKW